MDIKPTYEELKKTVKELERRLVKLTTKALRESEAKYMQLFNTVPAGIMLYDAKTKKMIDGNDATFDLYGYSREEFLNLTYWDITAEPEKSKETIPRVLSGEVKRIPLRYQKKKDGTVIPVEASVGAFRLNNRKVICGVSTDISEYLQIREKLEKTNQELRDEIQNREQAEDALQDSEERLKSFYDAALEGIALTRQGKIIDSNKQICELFGYERDELIGRDVMDLVVEEDREFVLSNIVSDFEKPYEHKAVHKDGSIIFLEVRGQQIQFQGQSARVTAIHDITERKRAEEALRESENKYRTLIKNAGEAIIVAQDGIIKFANPKGEELYGHSQEELASKPLTDFIHEEDREMVGERHKKRLRGQKAPTTYPFRIINKAGDTKWVQLSAVPFSWDNKPAVLCYMTDITERKQAEEALKKSEVWVRNIFKSLNEGVSVITPDRIFLDMNEAAQEMFGYTKEELVNVSSEMVHIDHEHYLEFGKKMKEVIHKGDITNFQFKMRRKNGEIFPSEHTASLMVDNKGKPIGIVSVVRDLSGQKKIEEEKEKLQTQLQQAQKMEAIATLAGGIAHEFNNALTSIVGNIQLLEMDFADNKAVKKYTEAMMPSSHRMANLTNQLLAYAQGGKYQARTMSLSDFVENILPIIKPTIDPTIRVETDLPRDIFSVRADSAQIQMVLSSVVNNSVEAIEGKGRIRIITNNEKIDASFVKRHPGPKPGPYACLTIEDDGKGMDKETVRKIFDPFFTTKFMGRGLGMAAVYGIIRNHDGWILVDSEQDKGTVVRIYLPAIEAEEIKKEAIVESTTEMPKGEGTILIIEDEEMVMNVICAVLERLGYRTLEAKTGREAVEIAKTFDGDIDLALLDIKLPDIRGDKVYPLIMEARPNLKVIVCSGYSIDTARGILDAGAQDFIQKPFSVKEISQKLREILDKE